MSTSQPPAEVLARYAWDAGRTCRGPVARGGFSGARLWRVDDRAGAGCLKLWPAGAMTAERLARIHALLGMARTAGATFVPRPLSAKDQRTVVEHAGRLWDVCTWMPGVADFHQNPTVARLEAACAALAQLHLAWTIMPERREPCPGVLRRLESLSDWQTLVRSGWQPLPDAADPVRPWAEAAWRLLEHRAAVAMNELQPWLAVGLPLHPCWCDPWHDHVLFTGDRVTGLVDHGSVKEDHAAVDLARMLGSFVGDDPNMWQRGIAAYREVRPLSDRETLLVSVLDRTGMIASAANWLRWLYHEQRSYADRQAVAERLRGIVGRLA